METSASAHLTEAFLAPAKSGVAPGIARKNLAAGLTIPAARSNDDDGAGVAQLPAEFNWAAIPLRSKDGDNASSTIDISLI